MKDQQAAVNPISSASPRNAAIVLIVVNVLSILAMLHHPTAHGGSPGDFLHSLSKMGWLNQLVHGTLITTTLINWLCLLSFAMPNLKQASIRNGILLYTLGTLAMVGAALTNGFVIHRLAEALVDASNALQTASPLLFELTWAVNQTLTGFGVIAMCAGVACWSIHLISGSRHSRLLGIAGLLMVILQIGMQWIHHGHYGVHQMLVFVVWHALWCIALAVLMLRKA